MEHGAGSMESEKIADFRLTQRTKLIGTRHHSLLNKRRIVLGLFLLCGPQIYQNRAGKSNARKRTWLVARSSWRIGKGAHGASQPTISVLSTQSLNCLSHSSPSGNFNVSGIPETLKRDVPEIGKAESGSEVGGRTAVVSRTDTRDRVP